MLRLITNRISLSIGLGDTTKSRYLKFRYLYKRSIVITIFSMLLNKILQMVGILMMLKSFNGHPLLDNLHYLYIRKVIASLRLLRLLVKLGININRSLWNHVYISIGSVHYLHFYCPSIVKALKFIKKTLNRLFEV